MDEPTTLPDGTELTLVADDGGDDLDEADGRELDAALAEAEADVVAGRVIPAADVLRALREKSMR